MFEGQGQPSTSGEQPRAVPVARGWDQITLNQTTTGTIKDIKTLSLQTNQTKPNNSLQTQPPAFISKRIHSQLHDRHPPPPRGMGIGMQPIIAIPG